MKTPLPSESVFGLFVDSFLVIVLMLGGAIALLSWLQALTPSPQQAEYSHPP